MTTEHIISKVQKLLRLAGANNSPEEAAAAASKAQDLIDQHNLTEALLAFDTAQPVDEEVVNFQTAGAPLDSQKTQQTWRVRLASTLAKINGCRIYLSGADIALVGRPSDAETVRYLYAYLTRETEQLADRHGKGMGRTWRNNFRLGVVDTITHKLHEQHRAFETIARASAGTALMRVNQALAVIEKRGSTVELFMRATLKLRSGGAISSHAQGHNQARARGREAGQSIRVGGARAGLTSGAKALKGGL